MSSTFTWYYLFLRILQNENVGFVLNFVFKHFWRVKGLIKHDLVWRTNVLLLGSVNLLSCLINVALVNLVNDPQERKRIWRYIRRLYPRVEGGKRCENAWVNNAEGNIAFVPSGVTVFANVSSSQHLRKTDVLLSLGQTDTKFPFNSVHTLILRPSQLQ